MMHDRSGSEIHVALAPDVPEITSLDQADGTITTTLLQYSVDSRILNDATAP
jgi:hypothetical protein